jgi:hypothetical protein
MTLQERLKSNKREIEYEIGKFKIIGEYRFESNLLPGGKPKLLLSGRGGYYYLAYATTPNVDGRLCIEDISWAIEAAIEEKKLVEKRRRKLTVRPIIEALMRCDEDFLESGLCSECGKDKRKDK